IIGSNSTTLKLRKDLMAKQDPIDIYFTPQARDILFSLTDRKDPFGLAAGSDDTFQHTISSVFTLFSALLEQHTPDLYLAEWNLIANSLRPLHGMQRLPMNLGAIASQLVLSLEDTPRSIDGIEPMELSMKIAGFSDVQLCAIYYHVQKYIVAQKRGRNYEFPKIQFKG
ncbi:TPA: hypothetical protein ACXIJJ_000001, partial [Pseudomonas aeruginosa]